MISKATQILPLKKSNNVVQYYILHKDKMQFLIRK